MKNAVRRIQLLALLVLPLATGCASAYHSYSGCQIPCQYYAPPPLPYPYFGQCVCHSHVASKYLSMPQATGDFGIPSESDSESTHDGSK